MQSSSLFSALRETHRNGAGRLVSNISAAGLKTGLRFQAMECSFLFAIASGPALGPTQSPIQWVGVKRQKREADHSPPYSAEIKTCEAVLQFPIHLHAVEFS
jgi:hypothetical protein